MASFETRKLTIEFSNACFSLMGGHSGGAINIHLYAGAVRSLIGKKEKGSEHKEEYDLRGSCLVQNSSTEMGMKMSIRYLWLTRIKDDQITFNIIHKR